MTAAAIDQTPEVMTTADGIPLKVSLRRAVRREKMISMLLISPLFLFIFVSFIIPIALLPWQGINNNTYAKNMPASAVTIWLLAISCTFTRLSSTPRKRAPISPTDAT